MLKSELLYCRKYMIVSYFKNSDNILKFRQAGRIVHGRLSEFIFLRIIPSCHFLMSP